MADKLLEYLGALEETVDLMKDTVTKNQVLEAANRLRDLIIDSIEGGGPPGVSWTPLSDATLKIRNIKGISSSKPLEESGGLLKNLRRRKVSDNVYKVGWFDGESTLKATYSIFGTDYKSESVSTSKIKVSKKMGIYLKNEFGVLIKDEVKIPPRPLLRPCARIVYDEYNKDIKMSLFFSTSSIGIKLESRDV